MNKYGVQRSISQLERSRWIIWREVLILQRELEEYRGIVLAAGESRDSTSYQGIAIPQVETWQLAEALCIAVIFSKVQGIAEGTRVEDIFEKFGPVQFIDNEGSRYIWVQPAVKGRRSGLGGRPDIAVTTSPEDPSSDNILQAIECKAVENLETRDIRREFGKAYDLDIGSYLIWSLWKPKPRIIEGAKRLGLDVSSFEFDTDRVIEFAQVPGSLREYVWRRIDDSWRARHFLESMRAYADDHGKKWLDR